MKSPLALSWRLDWAWAWVWALARVWALAWALSISNQVAAQTPTAPVAAQVAAQVATPAPVPAIDQATNQQTAATPAAPTTAPVSDQAAKTYQILDQQPDRIKFSQGCTGKNRIQILGIYAEARTQYKQAASNKAGRIAQHIIKFAPLKQKVKYAIRVDWKNASGEGSVEDSGDLSKQEARDGELFWRFSLPGTYRLIWLMNHRQCMVKIGSQFTIG